MPSRSLKQISLILLAVLMVSLPAVAQDNPLTRWEVFAGYSWLDPRAEINNQVFFLDFPDITKGFTVSTAYFPVKWVGVKLDSSGHFSDPLNVANIGVGPVVRGQIGGATFFAHGLVGWNRFVADVLPDSNAVSVTGGGGMDLNVHPRVSIRAIQFDWMYAHHNFGKVGNISQTLNVSGPRLSSGLVFKFGEYEPAIPPSASCAAQPGEIWAGEAVKVTATTANFNPKRTLTHQWSATGGQVEGTGESVTINTANLAPGSYTITNRVSDGRKGMAECTASFRVRQPQPPTITCSANPANLEAGTASAITCNGASPDNRPLTYTHNASAGQLTPNGANASLDTTGAQTGPITVTSQVSDDRNLTASTTTTVTVEAPPPPPPPPAAPEASKINAINFANNNPRVDNAAKAILDDVALRLQRDADAKLVIVGGNVTGERTRGLAGRRATNAKAYLTKEKGIDPTRIEVRSGGAESTADMYIVPPGATFNLENTQVVQEAPARRR